MNRVTETSASGMSQAPASAGDKANVASEPWQLQMFSRTLKKRKRYNVLRSLLTPLDSTASCLLVTCGDNNGAMNYRLRELGGRWSWADLEDRSIAEMSELLGEEVKQGTPGHLPFEDGAFDIVIAIDVHEHVEDPLVVMREMHRIAKPGGRVIVTTPGGDQRKIANRLKNAVGMSKGEYGHVRDGLNTRELRQLMQQCGITPRREVTFSRFFTEMIELAINFAYVKKLSRKSGQEVEKGTIAPATRNQLESVGLAYRVYSAAYPVLWQVSKLDGLLGFTDGYVALVEGVKPA